MANIFGAENNWFYGDRPRIGRNKKKSENIHLRSDNHFAKTRSNEIKNEKKKKKKNSKSGAKPI